jgi:hypothetical protein
MKPVPIRPQRLLNSMLEQDVPYSSQTGVVSRNDQPGSTMPSRNRPAWLRLISLLLATACLLAGNPEACAGIRIFATTYTDKRWFFSIDPATGAFDSFSVDGAVSAGISPNGLRVAYLKGTELRTVNVDGTADTLVLAGLPNATADKRVRWSPAGDRLAVMVGYAIRVVSLTGERLHEITDGSITDFDWSPDGTKLVYVKYWGYQAPVPDRYSSDIQNIGSTAGRISIVDLATGTTTTVLESFASMVRIDRHWVAYTGADMITRHFRWHPAGNGLATGTGSTTQPIRVSTTGGPQSKPQGYDDFHRSLSILDMEDASYRHPVRSHWSGYDPATPVWSPDGTEMAYVVANSGVHVIASDSPDVGMPALGSHTSLGRLVTPVSSFPGASSSLTLLDWIEVDGPAVQINLTTPKKKYDKGEVFLAEVTARVVVPRRVLLEFEEPLVGVDFPEILAVRETELPLPVELTPENPLVTFTVAVEASDYGTAKLDTRAIIRDGNETERIRAEREVLVNPLETEVTVTPAKPLLNQSPETKWGPRARALNDAQRAAGLPPFANLVEIEMKVRNGGEDPVQTVNIQAAADVMSFLTSTNLASPGVPLEPIRMYAPDGSQIDLTDPNANRDVMPVTLEGGEEITFAWVLKAFDANPDPASDDSAELEFEALVIGALNGKEVRDMGTKEFTIVDRPLLEWGIRPKQGRTAYQSGQVVRIDGYLENISTRDGKPPTDLRVMFYQMPEGNLGGGYMFDPLNPETGQTSKYYKIFELPAEGPGKILNLSAVMTSFPTVEPSEGKVKYGVRLWAVIPNPEAERGEDVEEADGQAIVKEDWGTEFAVTFSANRPAFTKQEECSALKDAAPGYVAWAMPFLCGMEQGLLELPEGMIGLGKFLLNSGKLTLDAGAGIVAWEMQTMRKTWRVILADPAALEAFQQEVYVQYRTMVELGVMAGEGGSKVPMVFEQFALKSVEAMADFFNAVDNGKLDEVEYSIGYFLGANPDLFLEPLIVARNYQRMSRALLAIEGDVVDNAVRASIVADHARQAATVDQRLRDAVAAGKSAASGLLPGDVLSDSKLLDIFGITREQRKQLQDIAANNGIILNFRSRNPVSVKLLKERLAWPKPQALKHKTVNRIDIDFLGYRKDAFGKLEMVEPRAGLLGPDGRALTDDALEEALDREMKLLEGRIGGNKVLEAEVRERMKARAKEWNNLFMDKLDPSQPGTLRQKITTAFEAELQYLPDQRDRVKQVGAKEARTVTYEPVQGSDPRAWEMKMTGPNGGEPRWITGDVDFLSILDEAGGLIRDPQKRREIYVQLESVFDMQHGESFTFYLQKVRKENLDLCTLGKPDAEAMVSISAVGDGQPRAAYFVDNLSIIDNPGCPNARWLPTRKRTPLPLKDLIRGKKPMEIRRADPTGEYMMLDGIHINTKPPLDLVNRFLPYTLDEAWANFLLSRNFLVPALLLRLFDAEGVPVIFTEDSEGTIIQGFEEGDQITLKEFTPDHGWRPVTLAQALAWGDPNVLELKTMTAIPNGSFQGETRAEILTLAQLEVAGDDFNVGDRVVFNPGAANEEIRTVNGLGSILFPSGLRQHHQAGEIIVSLGPDTTDRDGDLLTGLEEIQIGTDPDAADSDGDGMPDGIEISNGFNPLDSVSNFRIASFLIDPAGASITLTWNGQQGREYAVETSSMLGNDWEELARFAAVASGPQSVTLPIPESDHPQRFFRLKLIPLP